MRSATTQRLLRPVFQPASQVMALVALILVLLAYPLQSVAAADLDTWRDEIATLAQELEAGLDPALIADELEALQTEPVTTADGGMPSDLSGTIALLRADPPQVDAAVIALESLLAATSASASDVGAGDERAALDEVLQRQEFTGEMADDDLSLIERGLLWIDDQFAQLMEWIGADSPSGSFMRALLTLLGILVVIGALGLIVQAVRRRLAPSTTTRHTLDLPPDTTSADALTEAERLAAAGDFRNALRWRYSACLLRWQESGRLRIERSATNHEVLADVRARGDAEGARLLGPVVRQFEQVWYGDAPCGGAEYRAFVVASEPLWQHAAGGATGTLPVGAPA